MLQKQRAAMFPPGGGQWEVVREGFLETPAPKDE